MRQSPRDNSGVKGTNCRAPHSKARHIQLGNAEELSVGEKVVRGLIREVVERRKRGDYLTDEEIIAEHPGLMPRLGEALAELREIEKFIVQGTGRGTSAPNRKIAAGTGWGNMEVTAAEGNDDGIRSGLALRGYHVLHEISSGGQAAVFKAIFESTKTVVAIKVIHGGRYAGSRARTRFEREWNILAQLNHPNIVKILDQGRTRDGSFFLVMDFIDGPNLDDYVKEQKDDVTAIIRLFVKIALALDEAHERGVVHRDLKPKNIRVDSRGEPHILDFGLARLLADDSEGNPNETELTETGQLLGSLHWSSPEQIEGSRDSVDHRSDVYTLAVILFTSLAGTFPYPVNGSIRATFNHIAKTPPAPLSQLSQQHGINVGRAIDDIMSKALAKAPKQRYESAAQFACDLEGFLGGKKKPRKASSAHIGLVLVAGAIVSLLAGFWRIKGTSSPSKGASIRSPVGIAMVLIPAGTVGARGPLAHASIEEIRKWDSYSAEKPFYMSATDITQEEFLRVLGRHSSTQPTISLSAPEVNVTWEEAERFCERLSMREHQTYRLPTRAEWEYAFHSGQSGPLTQTNLDREGWYSINASNYLHDVAKKSADSLGLFDMAGNIRVWCLDSGGISSTTPAKGPTRVAAGADYLSPAAECLSPNPLERGYSPAIALPTIGFRIVRDSNGTR